MTSLHRSILPALAACCLLVSARAVPKPIRLYEIGAVRFTMDEQGHRWMERGLLDSLGRFTIDSVSGVLESVAIPPAVLNRTLISLESWSAYGQLGPAAVGNFVVDDQSGLFPIGLRNYYLVVPAPEAKLDLGDAVNLSARGRVAPGEEPLIGGFVIENQHRTVLIRGVGPELARLGVPHPVADPYIVIYKNGSRQFQLFNDDWGQRHDAEQIERISAELGLFALTRGSKDAAYLVELAPGAYTVHLSTDGPGGTGLLEIYVTP